MLTLLFKKLLDQKAATTRRQREILLKNRVVSELDVMAFGRHSLHMTGKKTSVRNSLLSAGDVTDKGHALWLDGYVGYIIQRDSPILVAMPMFSRELVSNTRDMGH